MAKNENLKALMVDEYQKNKNLLGFELKENQ